MFWKKEKEICGYKFKIVDKGLSEEQVADVLNQLTEKLISHTQSEQLVSPANLGQKVLTETSTLVAHIQQDALATLQTEVGRITTEVEEKAQRISKEAREEIEAALRTIVQAGLNVARQKIADIEAATQDKMGAIGDRSRETILVMEAHAQREVEGMVTKYNVDTERNLKAAATKVYESLLAQLHTLTSGLQDMISEEGQEVEPPSGLARQETPRVDDQSVEEADVLAPVGDQALVALLAEVNVPPPVDIAKLAVLRRLLDENPEFTVLSAAGSVDRGAHIMIEIPEEIPLLELLNGFSVVEEAVMENEPQESSCKKVIVNLKDSNS